MVRSIALIAAFAVSLSAKDSYTAAEVARHKTGASCWLTIDGQVYDVTKYLKRHEDFDYDIARHCGSEVSNFWHKKPQSGEEHSRKAERLLERYRVGRLVK